jgi:CRISPR-associated endonuclease/helicase Cas3
MILGTLPVRLWDEWLPGQARERISVGLPGGQDDGRLLLRWLPWITPVSPIV